MLLYISRDDCRPQIGEFEVLFFTPIKKLRHGVSIRGAGVFVADIGGEEFDESPTCFFAGARDGGRKPVKTGAGQLAAWDWNDGERQTG